VETDNFRLALMCYHPTNGCFFMIRSLVMSLATGMCLCDGGVANTITNVMMSDVGVLSLETFLLVGILYIVDASSSTGSIGRLSSDVDDCSRVPPLGTNHG